MASQELPLEFRPELWEGWRRCDCAFPQCKTILRNTAKAQIAVIPDGPGHYLATADRGRFQPWRLMEREILETVNKWAEDDGGWV